MENQAAKYVVRFLQNYFEQHGFLLPGRVPGYDIKLLHQGGWDFIVEQQIKFLQST